MTGPLLRVDNLGKTFRGRGRDVRALDGVSFELGRGRTIGIAGASGSGKSTLARILARLIPPDGGGVSFDGMDWLALHGAALRRQRRRLQLVFQDPLASINPRATVGRVLRDPIEIHGLAPHSAMTECVEDLLARVKLPASLAARHAHELSGGQRQRVAIARAIASRPDLLILDEPASALDVSLRGEILNLLLDIQDATGMAYIFISHDLAVVRAMADHVAVMEAGRVAEQGPADQIFTAPASPVTRALIAAVPRLQAHKEQTSA
jgi:peptide/nickel transport system ATP-binding protein